MSQNHYIQETADLLKVLGNVYRLQIVKLLAEGEKNVTQLNAHVRVSQPALSQHLTKLRLQGVVGNYRAQRQIYYHLKMPHLVQLMAVAEQMIAAQEQAGAAVTSSAASS